MVIVVVVMFMFRCVDLFVDCEGVSRVYRRSKRPVMEIVFIASSPLLFHSILVDTGCIEDIVQQAQGAATERTTGVIVLSGSNSMQAHALCCYSRPRILHCIACIDTSWRATWLLEEEVPRREWQIAGCTDDLSFERANRGSTNLSRQAVPCRVVARLSWRSGPVPVETSNLTLPLPCTDSCVSSSLIGTKSTACRRLCKPLTHDSIQRYW